ncbi:hypothetical protein, partial [Neisseria meningitidis]
MNLETKPIAETPNFIVLDQYEKIEQSGSYQSENQLEAELIADLQNQGYEYRKDLNSQSRLLENLRAQLQRLNDVAFSDGEWARFLTEYLDRPLDSDFKCNTSVLVVGTDSRIKHLA